MLQATVFLLLLTEKQIGPALSPAEGRGYVRVCVGGVGGGGTDLPTT